MKLSEKDNKKFAEFLGFETGKSVTFGSTYYIVSKIGSEIDKCYGVSNMSFHKSLDWINLLVEKIKSKTQVHKFEITVQSLGIDPYKVSIISDFDQFTNIIVSRGSLLESMYYACLEFIKMYNKMEVK